MTDTTRVSRLSAVRFWLWAALLYLAFVGLVYGLIRYTGRELDPMATATVGLGLGIVAAVFGLKYRAEVSADGATVKLRGVVPNTAARRRAVELAGSTIGVEAVVDELAVPGN